MLAACGWTCQKPPEPTRYVRSSARSRTKARPWTRWTPPSFSSTRSTETGLSSSTRGAGRRAGGEDDLTVVRAGGRDRLDRGHLRPFPLLHAEFGDPGGGDQAVVDRLDLVRAVLAQACPAVRVDGVLDPGAPGRDLARRELVAVGGHDRAVPAGLLGRQPRQAAELLGDHLALEAALGAGLGVLPVAAAAHAGTGVRARGLDPVLGRLQDPYGVGPQEAGVRVAVGHLGDDLLAGERVADEEDLVLGRTGDAVAAVRDGADLDLVLLPDQRRRGFVLHEGRLQGGREGRASARPDNSPPVYVRAAGVLTTRRSSCAGPPPRRPDRAPSPLPARLLLPPLHRAPPYRTRRAPLRPPPRPLLRGLRGLELVRDRGHHHAGGEEQAALEA